MRYYQLLSFLLCISFTQFHQAQNDAYLVESIPFNLPVDPNSIDQFSSSLDDAWTDVISLPFSINFFGMDYNQLLISSNGALSFDLSETNQGHFWTAHMPLPNNSDPSLKDGNIFFALHDTKPNDQDLMKWETFGSTPNRMFVVSLWNMPQFSCTDLLTSQMVVLYETTNIIEVFIQDKPVCSVWHNGNATLGIQNNNGSIAFVPPNRNTGAWATQSEAWRFTPNALSVDEFNFSKMKMFPNPSTDIVNFEMDYAYQNQLYVEVIDLQGKIVFNQSIKNKTLDVSQLDLGIYFLKVSNGETQSKVFKLIKR